MHMSDNFWPNLVKRAGRAVAVMVLAIFVANGIGPIISNFNKQNKIVSQPIFSTTQVSAQGIDDRPLTTIDRNAQQEAEAVVPKTSQDTFLQRLIKGLMYWIIDTFGRLTLALFNLLIGIAQYNGFTTEPIVTTGWKIVRDISNMFFIFAMLLIAFGTILRIQTYHYRSLLFRVILMATLVNLSKSITGFLIDISQIIMLTFVSAFSNLAGSSLAQALGMADLLKLKAPAEYTAEAGTAGGGFVTAPTGGAIASTGTIVASYVLGAIAMFLIFVTVLSIVITLLIRILKLWILTILSPIAFVGSVFKNFGSYVSKWWSTLGQELTAGPVLAFFLWLVLTIAKSKFVENSKSGFSKVGTFDPNYNPTNLAIGDAATLVNLLVVVGLLIAAVGVAKASGVAGAGVAGWGLAKLQGAGRGLGRLGMKGASYAGKGAKWVGAKALRETRIPAAMYALGQKIKTSGVGRVATKFFSEESKQGRIAELRARAMERGVFGGSEVDKAKAAGLRERIRSQRLAARLKKMDDLGIDSKAGLDAMAKANVTKKGKIIDPSLLSAIAIKKAQKGMYVNPRQELIEMTKGLDEDTRADLVKRVWSDLKGRGYNMSGIKVDGTLLEGDALRGDVHKELSEAATRETKSKSMSGIKDQVELNEDGRLKDEAAYYKLTDTALNPEFYENVSGAIKENIEDAILLAMANVKTEPQRQALASKYKELTGKEVTFESNTGRVTSIGGDATKAVAQKKLLESQSGSREKTALKQEQIVKPLTEAEDSLNKLLSTIKEAPEHFMEMQRAVETLSRTDVSDETKKLALDYLQDAQMGLEKLLEKAATEQKVKFIGRDGNEVSVTELWRQSAGNFAQRASDITALSQDPSAKFDAAKAREAFLLLGGNLARAERRLVSEQSIEVLPEENIPKKHPDIWHDPRVRRQKVVAKGMTGVRAAVTTAGGTLNAKQRDKEVKRVLNRLTQVTNVMQKVKYNQGVGGLDQAITALQTRINALKEGVSEVSMDELNALVDEMERLRKLSLS